MEYQQIKGSTTNSNWQQFSEEFLAEVYVQELEKTSRLPKIQSFKSGQQEKTRLCIKNMVSYRCIIAVKALLTKLGLQYNSVELMNVELAGSLSETKFEQLKTALARLDFELMEDKNNVLVEAIKNVIVEMVHSEVLPKTKFSEYLSSQLNHNYIYLSNLFSKVKGVTIEQFILSHKIERVKQLLLHNDLTLSEIAWKLQYSSVAHLSNQFKKITGITPTRFKNMNGQGLIALENL